MKGLLVLVIGVVTISLCFSCGGDGGSSGTGSGGETTVINGKVQSLITASTEADSDFTIAKIKKWLALTREAKAQDGISVSAIVDGVILDSDITDGEGDFTLILDLDSETDVSILFEVNDSIVSINILVTEGSIIELTITIDLGAPEGEEVEIVDMEDDEGPIRCETGTVEIIKNPGEEIIIDGGGEDCIRTAGNCRLTIDPENIVLTNCENCVDARGNSEVTLISPDGDIICEASENGFRARGTASIVAEASGTIDIFAEDNGLRADGTSDISLTAELCIIDSFEDPIDVKGNAEVDTSGCGEVLSGPVIVPSPTPEPTPGP